MIGKIRKSPRPFHTLEFAGSDNNELLPSVGHLERERDDDRSDKKGWS
jgi:hypothetical protein